MDPMAQRDDPDLPVPRVPDGEPRPSFPDVPRLELDQLLAQLVDRASSSVLHRTAEAAGDLVGARRAGRQVAEPGGTGRRSSGPPQRQHGGGLEVPVQVRGAPIGTRHLEDSDHGSTTTEDQELVQALASTAGTAIQGARLYESARRRVEWLQVSAAITRQLLSGSTSGAEALDLLARGCRDVVGADVVAVLRPGAKGSGVRQLGVDVLVAPGEGARAARSVPLAGTVLGRVFEGGAPESLVGGALEEESGALPWTGVQMGAVIAVPLVGAGDVRGVLCAARRPGRPGFSVTDTEMAGGFANQAAVAIELAEARADQQRAAVLDERERIATGLQDTVVQRLFGIGLAMQGVLAELGDGRAAGRLRAIVDEVDATIDHVRSTVFPSSTESAPVDPLDRVLDAVAEAGGVLGFEPDVRFSGLRSGRVAADLAEDVAAVVRGALLDVAGRGRSTTAVVDVVEDRDGLVVHVRDDDARAPDGPGAAGVDLRDRARRHGGTFTVSAATPHGVSQYWWVPRP